MTDSTPKPSERWTLELITVAAASEGNQSWADLLEFLSQVHVSNVCVQIIATCLDNSWQYQKKMLVSLDKLPGPFHTRDAW